MTFIYWPHSHLALISLLYNFTSTLSMIGSYYIFKNLTLKQTKYMLISRKSQSFLSSLPPLFLNSSTIEHVYSYKYLGVVVNSNLSWSPHISSVCSKSCKFFEILILNLILKDLKAFRNLHSEYVLNSGILTMTVTLNFSILFPYPINELFLNLLFSSKVSLFFQMLFYSLNFFL